MYHIPTLIQCQVVELVRNLVAHGDARYSHATSECGISSNTKADAHTSAASSRLNWRPHRFEWTRPFRGKTKSGLCVCAITFRTSYISKVFVPIYMKLQVVIYQWQLHSIRTMFVLQTAAAGLWYWYACWRPAWRTGHQSASSTHLLPAQSHARHIGARPL